MKKVTKNEKSALSLQIGQRVKNEAEQRDLTYKDMANLTGYAEKSIPRFYNGTSVFKDDSLRVLASAWGLRFEYLKCLDDFKTNKDILQFEKNKNEENQKHEVSQFTKALDYLNSIGLHIEPTLYWHVNRYQRLLDDYDLMEEHIVSEDDSYISELSETLNGLDSLFVKLPNDFYIELKSLPNIFKLSRKKYVSSLSKSNKSDVEVESKSLYEYMKNKKPKYDDGSITDSDEVYVYDPENEYEEELENYGGIEIVVRYKIISDSKKIGVCTAQQISSFMNNFDNMAKTLFNATFEYSCKLAPVDYDLKEAIQEYNKYSVRYSATLDSDFDE